MSETLAERLARHVVEIQDFPKPGLMFRDITPILQDPDLFRETVDALAEGLADRECDLICGIESRGFIFSAPLAYRMGKGYLPIRWAEKLPPERSTTFQLEYGFDTLEVHPEAFEGGKRILLVDDLLATGATLKACADLVTQAGGRVVAAAVVVEVPALEGRKNLKPLEVLSLCEL